MESEKGDSHSSSEEIISEDSSEESIVIRTIDRLSDTSSEKSIGCLFRRLFLDWFCGGQAENFPVLHTTAVPFDLMRGVTKT